MVKKISITSVFCIVGLCSTALLLKYLWHYQSLLADDIRRLIAQPAPILALIPSAREDRFPEAGT